MKVNEVKVKKTETWREVYEKLVKLYSLSANTNVIGRTDYLIMVGKGQTEIEFKKELTMEKLVEQKEISLTKYITVSDDEKDNPYKIKFVFEE